MKGFLSLLFILFLGVTACTPAPTPTPLPGVPIVPQATTVPSAFPAGKLPIVAIQSPTPPPPPVPTTKITSLQAHGGHVGWSGSTNLLVFDEQGKDGFSDVYTARLDGTDKQCLTCSKRNLPQKHNGNPDWSPAGDYIVFQSEDPQLKLKGQPQGEVMASPDQGYNNNIWIMTVDGLRFWQLTHVASMAGVLHPRFSPDGRKLTWSEMIGSGGIGQWVIKLADFGFYKGQPQLSNIQTLSPWSLQWYETYDFSLDQTRIIFGGVPYGKWFYDTDIFTYNLVTQVTERLTQNNELDENAHFSPDGKWIAWVSSSDIPQLRASSLQDTSMHPFKTEVWIMKADGSHRQRLTRFNDSTSAEGAHAPVGVTADDIAWGPDSKSLALRILIGHNESIVRVDFDPQTLAQ